MLNLVNILNVVENHRQGIFQIFFFLKCEDFQVRPIIKLMDPHNQKKGGWEMCFLYTKA